MRIFDDSKLTKLSQLRVQLSNDLKQRECLQLTGSAGLLKTRILTSLGPVLPTTKDVCTLEPICGGVGPR